MGLDRLFDYTGGHSVNLSNQSGDCGARTHPHGVVRIPRLGEAGKGVAGFKLSFGEFECGAEQNGDVQLIEIQIVFFRRLEA